MSVTAIKPRPFSWSWSRLKNFRTCPKRHWHVDIQKEFKDESEALTWGQDVHDAMASRISKGAPLPKTMVHYEHLPASVVAHRKQGYDIFVEQKLAMTKSYEPCSFFDAGAWFRGIIDVLMIAPSRQRALMLDWKTGGKINPEYEQLGLFAQLVFAHYPNVDQVATAYVWLGHDDETREKHKREGMLPLWNGLAPAIRIMEEAWRTTTYPPKPSGLCKRYCPVTSCPYHGRGDR